MKKTIFFSLILIIFSVPACAKTETQLEDKITLESAIEQYENTSRNLIEITATQLYSDNPESKLFKQWNLNL